MATNSGKHGKKDIPKIKIIESEDEQNSETRATIEYIVDDDSELEAKRAKIPSAVYKVAIILVAVLIGLVVWSNKDNLTLSNIGTWIKTQFVGAGVGDGFPKPIMGTHVDEANFTHRGSDVVALSDMALISFNSGARDIFSVRHSFNNPAMKAGYGRYVVYNHTGKNYFVQNGADTVISGETEGEILSAAVAKNGKFALALDIGAGSRMNVYSESGNLEYYYVFADDIFDISINAQGNKGAVCTVRSEKGEIVSKITILDFSRTEAVYEYEVRGNMIIGVYWTENGKIYAVGDMGTLAASDSNYEFATYGYDGRTITTMKFEDNKAFVAISGYEHAGASTLLVFNGSNEPVLIEAEDRISLVSSFGSTVGVLVGNDIVFYDYFTAVEQARVTAGIDVKSIALASESAVYVLGIGEIRIVSVK